MIWHQPRFSFFLQMNQFNSLYLLPNKLMHNKCQLQFKNYPIHYNVSHSLCFKLDLINYHHTRHF